MSCSKHWSVTQHWNLRLGYLIPQSPQYRSCRWSCRPKKVAADSLWRVQLRDGRECILHLEFQGRRSEYPMPIRMLNYLARLARDYSLPIFSVVLYFQQGAGRYDTGHHQHLDPHGEVVLAWHYRVIHLWRMKAEELLALGQRSLLPLASLMQFQNPSETLPKIVTAIRAEPDERLQSQWLKQLLGLMTDEELTTMTEQLLSELDLEELREFPFLWKQYQRMVAKAEEKAEELAAQANARQAQLNAQEAQLNAQEARLNAQQTQLSVRQMVCDNVLEVLVTRFALTLPDYRRIEHTLAKLTELEQLRTLLRLAARAVELTEFEQGLANEHNPDPAALSSSRSPGTGR